VKKLKVVFLFLFVIYFSACFSPWNGIPDGEGIITINFGDSARAVRYVDLNSGEYKDFRHDVILKNNTREISKTFSTSTGSFAVPAGTYNIAIKAFDENNALRAYGSIADVLVVSGQEKQVDMTMYSAAGVSSWSELDAVINYINDEASDNDVKREFYILIQESFSHLDLFFIERGKITLVADKNVTISVNNLSSSMFYITHAASLTLGAEGMPGTITINGNANANSSLIEVSGGELVMKNGITLTGNHVGFNYSYISGGAVFIAGGTFTMEGGAITGNSAFAGGGVAVGIAAIGEEVNFNLKGGEIYGNEAIYGGGVFSRGNFNKTGGTITGSDGGSRSNTAISGYAVYAEEPNTDNFDFRDTTAGSDVILRCGVDNDGYFFIGRWERYSGNGGEIIFINFESDLRKIGVDSSFPMNGHYMLRRDINISGIWNPIGTQTTPFMGILDGNEKIIVFDNCEILPDNYFVPDSWNYQNAGLFGYSDGVIKNLRLEGEFTVISANVNAGTNIIMNIGAIAGVKYGDIKNVSSNVNIYYYDNYHQLSFGGIAGSLGSGSITNCYNSGIFSVTGSSSHNVFGGIVGGNSGTMRYCWTKVEINFPNGGSNFQHTGGIAGFTYAGEISNCVVLGSFGDIGEAIPGRVSGALSNTAIMVKNFAYTEMNVNGEPRIWSEDDYIGNGRHVNFLDVSEEEWWKETAGWNSVWGGNNESIPWKWDAINLRPVLWFEE